MKFYHTIRNIIWKWKRSQKVTIILYKMYYLPIFTRVAEMWT